MVRLSECPFLQDVSLELIADLAVGLEERLFVPDQIILPIANCEPYMVPGKSTKK